MTLVDLLNRDRWMVLMDGFHRGGWTMWLILAVFVIALIIAVNRFFTLYVGARLNVSAFLERMMALIEAGDYTKAVETSNMVTKHPLPQVLRAGLAKSNRREREGYRCRRCRRRCRSPGSLRARFDTRGRGRWEGSWAPG